jgi:hypothetical protein
VLESGVAVLRVINTDALGFLEVWGRWAFVEIRRSERRALTTRVAVPYWGLIDVLSTRRVSVIEVTHVVEI